MMTQVSIVISISHDLKHKRLCTQLREKVLQLKCMIIVFKSWTDVLIFSFSIFRVVYRTKGTALGSLNMST